MNSEEFPKYSNQFPKENRDDDRNISDEEIVILPSPFDEESDLEILELNAENELEPRQPLEIKAEEKIELPIVQEEIVEAVTIFPSPQDSLIRSQIEDLERQKQTLEAEVANLKSEKERQVAQQAKEIQETIAQMVKEGLRELEQQKQALEISIEQLERRRERIREEMRTTFAGVSQDLAVRVQGFKDYLVGSLQDLAAAAEQLDLPSFEPPPERSRASQPMRTSVPQERQPEPPPSQFGKQGFQDQNRRIRELLDQYRSRPDYYGPPWQLRRTFEPIHAERVQNWFLNQGGRGAIRGMGSRLQNILIASSVISILRSIHGDRCRMLVLADSPERLGEWRRGLQDCLGISRADFGPERGVVLFEAPEALLQKADRLMEDKLLPLIIIDDTEDRINLSLLQFPLWLAFALDPQQMSSYYY